MPKECFIGGLSFLGKVSLDSCPKGGSFSQGVYSEFLSIPFFISHKWPQAASAKAGTVRPAVLSRANQR